MAETNENAGQLTGLMVDLIKQGEATHTSVLLIRDDLKGIAGRLLKVEDRMSKTETKDGIQAQQLAAMKERLASQDEAIESLVDTVQSLRTQIAVWSSAAGVGGAVLMALFSEWALPLLLGR